MTIKEGIKKERKN